MGERIKSRGILLIEEREAVKAGKYRVFHKDLTDVKVPITCDPTITEKCECSLMTLDGTNPLASEVT
jgi:mitochondrial fission protein ELM1